MALFGFGKKKSERKEKPDEKSVPEERVPARNLTRTIEGFSAVIHSPRITEKVTALQEKRNVYTFVVSADATKHSVKQAVARLYKVHPAKIRLLPVPAKRVFVRGKWGVKQGGRKAYVTLPKGEKIEMA